MQIYIIQQSKHPRKFHILDIYLLLPREDMPPLQSKLSKQSKDYTHKHTINIYGVRHAPISMFCVPMNLCSLEFPRYVVCIHRICITSTCHKSWICCLYSWNSYRIHFSHSPWIRCVYPWNLCSIKLPYTLDALDLSVKLMYLQFTKETSDLLWFYT